MRGNNNYSDNANVNGNYGSDSDISESDTYEGPEESEEDTVTMFVENLPVIHGQYGSCIDLRTGHIYDVELVEGSRLTGVVTVQRYTTLDGDENTDVLFRGRLSSPTGCTLYTGNADLQIGDSFEEDTLYYEGKNNLYHIDLNVIDDNNRKVSDCIQLNADTETIWVNGEDTKIIYNLDDVLTLDKHREALATKVGKWIKKNKNKFVVKRHPVKKYNRKPGGDDKGGRKGGMMNLGNIGQNQIVVK